MDNELDTQCLHRISLIEADLLHHDRLSGEEFIFRWKAHADFLKQTIETGSLSPSTLATAEALADRAYAAVESLIELELLAKKLTLTIIDETTSILAATPSMEILPSHIKSIDLSPSPGHIKLCYEWLLDNLSNPYPTTGVRNNIAQRTGAARKDIDNWFIDARKRIGWNTLRKRHFANKRVDIVDASTRFFVQDDDKRPLDTNVELEFASIQKCAKDLYADRFTETKLANQLDTAVKDLTPSVKVQARKEAERRHQEAHRRGQEALAASSYPSPKHSPGRSPELFNLVPLEDEDLVTTHSESITGRKRCSQTPDEDNVHPNKRNRLGSPGLTTGLPSPTLSSHELSSLITSPPAAIDPTLLPSISRKRRLSDADVNGIPKRPRNLPTGPRMHVVSDPLPGPSVLSEATRMGEWFNTHFGIPEPVVVDDLDTSQQLDVEVFNYSFVDLESPLTIPEPLSRESYSPQILDNAVPALVADEPPVGNEISTNTFDINELFTEYEEPSAKFSSGDLANHGHHPSQFMLRPPLVDFSSLTNLPSIPFDIPFDLTLDVDTAPSLSLYNDSNFTWFLPPFIPDPSGLNPVEILHDFGVAQDASLMFGNTALEIDTLPAMPTSTGLPSSEVPQEEDKAEMERRLAEMKEAMRTLEQKIAQTS